ncbi:MAG: cytochrome c [Burkholderiaceae bacterium]|nr:cytochrome c [Burkholderiaceae bacterium]
MRLRSALMIALLGFVGAQVSAQGAGEAGQAELDLGKQLFTKSAKPACALCHTLRDAQSEGAVGPVLDEIKPDAERVKRALRNGLGNMPAFPHLSEAELAALARYVSQASGGTAAHAAK